MDNKLPVGTIIRCREHSGKEFIGKIVANGESVIGWDEFCYIVKIPNERHEHCWAVSPKIIISAFSDIQPRKGERKDE